MPDPIDLRVGIDVGGTNTDAVVLDRDDHLLASVKTPTTVDVTQGILAALVAVLGEGAVEPARVTHVMLGTTHATNAVVQRRGLDRVAVVRIGAPATRSVPPLTGWPPDLRAAVSVGEVIVRGGAELDGRELVAFDPHEVRRFCTSLGERPRGVAITGVFSPVESAHERLAAAVVADELGLDVHLSLSHEIGSLGLLERENATVLNAALAGPARAVASALRAAVAARGFEPRTFFAQNDGTLMALERALRFPVRTIGSGPANGLRGAAYLTGLDDVVVIDVGGTTTDVGVLRHGFPRESMMGIDVGGVPTNIRAPDLVSIAIGGGSVIRPGAPTQGAERVTVGPDSVGYRLTKEALVFGGTTPTLTDAAVAAGRLTLTTSPGGPVALDEGARGALERQRALLLAGLEVADRRVAEAVDRIKTARGEVCLVVVGGAGALVPERIPGVREILRPADGGCANAIGAAIASVSGQVERVVRMGPGERERMLGELGEAACANAIAAGADPSHVRVVEVDEVPLAYLTEGAARVRVRAAGPLQA